MINLLRRGYCGNTTPILLTAHLKTQKIKAASRLTPAVPPLKPQVNANHHHGTLKRLHEALKHPKVNAQRGYES